MIVGPAAVTEVDMPARSNTRVLLAECPVNRRVQESDFRIDQAPVPELGEEDVAEGIAVAPRAFIGLLAGENRGKQLVRVAAPQT